MKNTIKFFGIISIVAVIGFSMAACGGGDDGGGNGGNGTPAELNGVWVAGNEELTINKSSFELKLGTIVSMKGTCTTTASRSISGSITLAVTELHGDYLEDSSTTGQTFESKWYSRNDLKGLGNTDAQLDQVFVSLTGTYTDTALTIEGTTYSKKSGGDNPPITNGGNLSAGWFEAIGNTAYRVIRNSSETPPDNVIIPATWNGKPVTEIGGIYGTNTSTFAYCTNIKSVSIPNSVKIIRGLAFSGCTGLTGITIPNSVTHISNQAFRNCTGLTSISIPNSVTDIDFQAFDGCTKLAEITIPSSVSYIGYLVFNDTPWLSSQPTGDVYAGKVFLGYKGTMSANTAKTLREDTTGIASRAFANSTNLTSITIPNGVKVIGADAFYRCTGLTGISIPGSVTRIDSGAFYYCNKLAGSISIPSGVTSIAADVFAGTAITGVTIPATVTDIGDGAFEGCKSLNNVTIPGNVTKIGWQAFKNCTSFTSITIPGKVTNIDSDAFVGCTSLTSVTMQCPDNNWISENAFPGDLIKKFKAGGTGRYTTSSPVNENSVWAKQP